MRLSLTRALVVFDLETTGTSIKDDRIIELGAVKLRPNEKPELLFLRVNPEMPISPETTKVHGITDDDVKDEPTFLDLADTIEDFFSGSDIGGYNSDRFDLPILAESFNRIGRKFPAAEVNVVDAYTIFRLQEPHSLERAHQFYCGRSFQGAHNALADAKATARVLAAQIDAYDEIPCDIPSLDEFCHAKDPRWVDKEGKLLWDDEGEVVFSFGKHQGDRLRDLVSRGSRYLFWILDQNFPPDMVNIIREAMAGRYPERPEPAPAE